MRTTIGVLLCAAALVSGCGTVSGQAEAEDPTASDPAFDPCEDIPDEAVRGIGMDPATEARDILGVHQPGAHICQWSNATHSVAVLSTNYTLDDVRRNPDNEKMTEIEIGGRPALEYRVSWDSPERTCDIAFPSGAGTVSITATEAGTGPVVQDPCRVTRQSAGALLPFIPE